MIVIDSCSSNIMQHLIIIVNVICKFIDRYRFRLYNHYCVIHQQSDNGDDDNDYRILTSLVFKATNLFRLFLPFPYIINTSILTFNKYPFNKHLLNA